MKKILILIFSFIATLNIRAADADWKIHPIFDEEVSHVIETPDYVYFTSRQMSKNTLSETFFSLFRYSKAGDELMALSPSNILNGNSVRDVIYNPYKGYMLVLYKDYNIDLLLNNGKVVSFPYYYQSSITNDKFVYSMSVDKENDRVYLATDFGYVAINDKKNEIAESRIYNIPVQSFCRVGDQYLLISENELLMAPVSDPRLSINQYENVGTFDNPLELHALDGNIVMIVGETEEVPYIKILSVNADGVNELNDYRPGKIQNIEYNPSGISVSAEGYLYQFNSDGSLTKHNKPTNYWNMPSSSYNFTEIWSAQKRKGLSSIKKSGDNWNVVKNWMLPNAPATYGTSSFINHPQKGLLLISAGSVPSTAQLDTFFPMQFSGLKKDRWTNYAPAYTNPDRTNILNSPSGMVMDPDNNSYIYITSYHNGILRLNLDNPTDILHLSDAGDSDRGKDGFVVMPSRPQTNIRWSNISAPKFDKNNNLWATYANFDNAENPHPYLYCWLAADRKASTSASNVKQPKVVEINQKVSPRNTALLEPLLKTGNGLLVFANNEYDEKLILFDTNGTPEDMSDDKVYYFQNFIDSDGSHIELRNVKCIWEDPSTGYVWLGHLNGLCYFSPSAVKQGDYTLYRVKVSRNDGTNLADYLLEGVSVNGITADSEGRKWFATAGGGVVCTTSDCREIIEEFTAANSPLPSDDIYGISYNSDNNSLMFSTSEGYGEYFLPAVQTASTKSDIRVYPNPVRPEYSGYVTITDIPQGSFVKITDVKGNLVKELGVMNGFELLWDISDSNYNRVKSGVYYIMVSPSGDSSSYSGVGKVLVMN